MYSLFNFSVIRIWLVSLLYVLSYVSFIVLLLYMLLLYYVIKGMSSQSFIYLSIY